jgi:hypothetical protein
MDWLLKVLSLVLGLLPYEEILKVIIKWLRNLASSSENKIDDAAVDFIEQVFMVLGWITSDASTVSIPATGKKDK